MNLFKNSFINLKKKIRMMFKLNISNIKYTVLVITFFLNSCNKKYKYETGVRFFLKEEFKEDILDGRYYFFLLEDCNSCQGDNLNLNLFAKNINFQKVKIIIIGEVFNDEQATKVMQITEKYSVFRDLKSKIYSYETGFGKSMLIDFKKDNLIHNKFITDPLIDTYLKDYLNTDFKLYDF